LGGAHDAALRFTSARCAPTSPLDAKDLLSRDDAVHDRETLDAVHRNTLRLLRLVNALLDFSRLEAGRTKAQYVPTVLSGFSADLASSFRSAVEKAGLRFSVECQELAESVYLDRDTWEKIVLNLLSNALKFTLEGSISVRTYARDGRACLEVEDTGTGIAAGELALLFDRFHRAGRARGATRAPGSAFRSSGSSCACTAARCRSRASKGKARAHGLSVSLPMIRGLGHVRAPCPRLAMLRRRT
jgi:signal transduction histidine kinase